MGAGAPKKVTTVISADQLAKLLACQALVDDANKQLENWLKELNREDPLPNVWEAISYWRDLLYRRTVLYTREIMSLENAQKRA